MIDSSSASTLSVTAAGRMSFSVNRANSMPSAFYGNERYEAGYNAAVEAGTKAAADAKRKRTRDNTALAAHQTCKDEGMTP